MQTSFREAFAIAFALTLGATACAQDAIESTLTQGWTRQSYVDAYQERYDQNHPDWASWVNTLASNSSVGRFDLSELKPVAALYRETGDSKYFDAAHAILIAAAASPPTDEEFSLGEIGYIYEQIVDSPLMSQSSRNAIEGLIAQQANVSLGEEKGTAMNRGISNAVGLAYAANLLPNHSDRQSWIDYHTDNWNNDMWRLRDTHENSGHYNMLYLPMFVKYVEVAGLNEQEVYNDPNIKAMFDRFADIKTPLGINAAYGHGLGVFDGLIAPGVWEKLSDVYDDGRYKYLGQRALNARRMAAGENLFMATDDVGALVAFDYADDSVAPTPDDQSPRVNYYERQLDGHRAPDKIVMSQGRDGVGTKLIMNLFDGGGHGAADGSSIVGLFYNNSPLLGTPSVDTGQFEQQHSNLMLVRRPGEEFAYSGESNLGDGQWHRVTIDLDTPESVVGNYFINTANIGDLKLRISREDNGASFADYDVYFDDMKFVGPDGELVIHDFEGAGDASAFGGVAVTGATPGSTGVRVDGSGTWTNFQEPSGINASDYETLEFWVKLDLGAESDVMPWVNTVIDGNSPQYSNRWYPHEMNTSHRGEMTTGHAFEKLQVASTDIEVKDNMGGDNAQRRDIMVLPNGLVWVRDQFTFNDDQSAQVGPIWNVQDIESLGSNWYQTTQDGGLGAYAPDMSLLVYFLDDARYDIESAVNPQFPGHNGVYQKWEGNAQAGDQYTFNTLLFANDPTTDDAALFRFSIQSLLATDTETVLRHGDALMVDNTLRSTLFIDSLATDAEFLYLEHASDDLVTYAAAIETNSITYDSQTIVDSDATLQLVEFLTEGDDWRYIIQTESSTLVDLFVPQPAAAYRIGSGGVLQGYDPEARTLSVSLPVGEVDIYAVNEHAWTSNASTGLWSDPANWSASSSPDYNWMTILDNQDVSDGKEALVASHSTVDSAVVQGTVGEMRLEILAGVRLTATYGVEIRSGGVLAGGGTIEGDLTLLQGSAFEGVLSAADSLHVIGDVVLDGALVLTFADDFEPNLGDQYEVLTASNVSGLFSETAFFDVPHAIELNLIYVADGVLVEIAASGDINSDGLLDEQDVDALIANWRADTSEMSTLDKLASGDLNADGVTDFSDWHLLREAINNIDTATEPPSVATVPEPLGWTIALLAVLGLYSHQRNV